MQYTREQVMLTLAYISYTSIALVGSNSRNAKKLFGEINCWLDTLDPVKDQWEIVWGPGVFKFPLTVFNDNLMYIVRNKQDKNEYCIAIRGTNPVSLSSWLLEDLLVGRMCPWKYGHPSGDPEISLSTAITLNILQNLRPPRDLPGGGQDLMEYLESVLAASDGEVRINLTGHSLAGLLAPTLALWLVDTRKTDSSQGEGSGWDPEGRTRITTYSFAGLTAGNADFAAHSNKQIGPHCSRFAQSLDIVPYFWNEETMAKVPTIYEPHLTPSEPMSDALEKLAKKVEGLGYTQIETGIERKGIFTQHDLFLTEAVNQHTDGYPAVLGLSDVVNFMQISLGKCPE